MKDKKQESHVEGEDVQRAVRPGTKFTLAKAIGHLGGRDLMKGASPVTRKRQAELEMKHYLDRHLVDIEGALQVVLLRRVTESKVLLERGYDQPIEALGLIVDRILGSEQSLRGFVRDVDAQWGRANFERPHFEREGQPQHPEDPYTFASVRETLIGLLKTLRGE